MQERRACGVRSRGAVHSTPGVGRRGGEIQAPDPGFWPSAHRGNGPKHQLLVQL